MRQILKAAFNSLFTLDLPSGCTQPVKLKNALLNNTTSGACEGRYRELRSLHSVADEYYSFLGVKRRVDW